MQYVPPFEILKSCLTFESKGGELQITGSYEDFINLIRRLIAGIRVDDAWYRTRYPDIDEAIKSGIVRSAQEHFVTDGYFEGRLPFPIRVDERWYLEQNSGVGDFVRQGKLESGQQHFEDNGYLEGRLPFSL